MTGSSPSTRPQFIETLERWMLAYCPDARRDRAGPAPTTNVRAMQRPDAHLPQRPQRPPPHPRHVRAARTALIPGRAAGRAAVGRRRMERAQRRSPGRHRRASSSAGRCSPPSCSSSPPGPVGHVRPGLVGSTGGNHSVVRSRCYGGEVVDAVQSPLAVVFALAAALMFGLGNALEHQVADVAARPAGVSVSVSSPGSPDHRVGRSGCSTTSARSVSKPRRSHSVACSSSSRSSSAACSSRWFSPDVGAATG